ncbi:MAG: XRE family transcriptional regulator [bacterium]|nr:XRE family transcriptional regulator [bacterium]
MPKKSFKVEINPEVIKYLRETSGWSIEEIAKKLKISIENYKEIEAGREFLTFQQIKQLSKLFQRPTSAFFLPQAPKELPISSAFRVLPKTEKRISKELLLAIRKAQYYQSIVNEIILDLNISFTPKIEKTKLEDNPIEVAIKERNESRIPIEKQYKFKDAYEAFNTWRKFIESKNILVFQFKFPLEDARGFSLMDTLPYVIVINSQDNILARIFTLFHEYAHLILGIPEIYIQDSDTSKEIEKWCDTFASEFLIPTKELEKNELFELLVKTEKVMPKIIENLSREFKVSKKAILTKLMLLNVLSYEDYEEQKAKIESKIESKKNQGKSIITPAKKCVQEKGEKFILTVLESKEKGLITTQDLLEFLSINYQNLDKLEKLLSKR